MPNKIIKLDQLEQFRDDYEADPRYGRKRIQLGCTASNGFSGGAWVVNVAPTKAITVSTTWNTLSSLFQTDTYVINLMLQITVDGGSGNIRNYQDVCRLTEIIISTATGDRTFVFKGQYGSWMYTTTNLSNTVYQSNLYYVEPDVRQMYPVYTVSGNTMTLRGAFSDALAWRPEGTDVYFKATTTNTGILFFKLDNNTYIYLNDGTGDKPFNCETGKTYKLHIFRGPYQYYSGTVTEAESGGGSGSGDRSIVMYHFTGNQVSGNTLTINENAPTLIPEELSMMGEEYRIIALLAIDGSYMINQIVFNNITFDLNGMMQMNTAELKFVQLSAQNSWEPGVKDYLFESLAVSVYPD